LDEFGERGGDPQHGRGVESEPSDLHRQDPADHVALLMCPHCAIGGCGVFSARLTRDDKQVRWEDIAPQWPQLDELGAFVFDADQYDQVLRPLAAEQQHQPAS
jgi:hypothetical protein